MTTSKTETSGWFFAIGAFTWWGLAPIYFKAIAMVSAPEILAHRIIWCIPVTLLLMFALQKKILIKQTIANKKLLLGLVTTTLLISGNWFIFTWAVTHEHILATSLGYFINPIMSILMGVILLGERITRLQWAAAIAVSLGVTNQIVNYGEIPWVSLSLAISFALYGFIRKQLSVDSLNGLLVETGIALPVAVAYLAWSLSQQSALFLSGSWDIDLLLMAGGIVTAVPLIWFGAAAKKIPLNSLGFLQFLAPSISFILATQVYNEPLGAKQLLSFILIWIGLGLYLIRPIQNIFRERIKER